ncbi:hypothetical protein OAB94_01885 [Flavobacteriaceae bacterium]|nr:hypothetical protein [Flavobacteriaceae bacterium]
MKHISLVQTETLIDTLNEEIRTCLDRDKTCMLVRAKHEAFILLRTLTYINQ